LDSNTGNIGRHEDVRRKTALPRPHILLQVGVVELPSEQNGNLPDAVARGDELQAHPSRREIDAGREIDAPLPCLGGAESVQAGRGPARQIDSPHQHGRSPTRPVTSSITYASLPTLCRIGPVRTAADTRSIDFRPDMLDSSAESGSRCAFYRWPCGWAVLAR